MKDPGGDDPVSYVTDNFVPDMTGYNDIVYSSAVRQAAV